jgi:hypothetical protein
VSGPEWKAASLLMAVHNIHMLDTDQFDYITKSRNFSSHQNIISSIYTLHRQTIDRGFIFDTSSAEDFVATISTVHGQRFAAIMDVNPMLCLHAKFPKNTHLDN